MKQKYTKTKNIADNSLTVSEQHKLYSLFKFKTTNIIINKKNIDVNLNSKKYYYDWDY